MHSEERKMEIVLLVRDTEAYRESRMTDVSNQGVWTYADCALSQ